MTGKIGIFSPSGMGGKAARWEGRGVEFSSTHFCNFSFNFTSPSAPFYMLEGGGKREREKERREKERKRERGKRKERKREREGRESSKVGRKRCGIFLYTLL
jgi:hypothetical protein